MPKLRTSIASATTFSVIPRQRPAVAVTCNNDQSDVAAGDAGGDVIRLWSR